jgi:ubiquitin C-terminal hydrolase
MTISFDIQYIRLNLSRSHFDLVKQHLMGTCVHQSKCLTCSSITQSQDLFYDLSIGFHDQISTHVDQERIYDLQALIDQTFAWESLINENQFACDQCQTKQDGSRRMFLTLHPNYLVLLLKRFVHNRLTGKYEKCLDRTTLPEFIQLLTVNETVVSYRLKAIVVHHGLSMNIGHYYAFVLFHADDSSDKNNDKHLGWWLFNDTHVEHLTFEQVDGHFQRFPSATPYVLIFEKQLKGKQTTSKKKRNRTRPIIDMNHNL